MNVILYHLKKNSLHCQEYIVIITILVPGQLVGLEYLGHFPS